MLAALDRIGARWGLARAELAFAAFLVFAFGSGVQAHLMPSVYPLTRLTTDGLLLVVVGGLLAFVYRRARDPRLLYWGGVTYLGTFALEAIGVATGLIFGEYHYGPTMWVQWLGVPLVIALNWTALILATNYLAGALLRHPLAISAAAALLIVGYDYCIEPVAIRLDYWQWQAGYIPTQNYLAWGLIAFVFSLPLNYLNIRFRHPLLLVYALAQLAFFLLLLALFSPSR